MPAWIQAVAGCPNVFWPIFFWVLTAVLLGLIIAVSRITLKRLRFLTVLRQKRLVLPMTLNHWKHPLTILLAELNAALTPTMKPKLWLFSSVLRPKFLLKNWNKLIITAKKVFEDGWKTKEKNCQPNTTKKSPEILMNVYLLIQRYKTSIDT